MWRTLRFRGLILDRRDRGWLCAVYSGRPGEDGAFFDTGRRRSDVAGRASREQALAERNGRSACSVREGAGRNARRVAPKEYGRLRTKLCICTNAIISWWNRVVIAYACAERRTRTDESLQRMDDLIAEVKEVKMLIKKAMGDWKKSE